MRIEPKLIDARTEPRLNDNNLVLWLNDNGKTNSMWRDYSGKNNHGTVYGAGTPPPATPGALGYTFDGLDDYIDVGNNASLNITNAITISAWIKGVVNSQFYGIISKDKYTVPASRSYSFVISDTNKLRLFLGSDASSTINSINNVPNNAWTHVVGTFDGTTEKLYINGAFDNSISSIPITLSSVSVIIGAINPATPAYFFNGSIDEVRIYNRALSQGEISNYFGKTRKFYGV